MLPYIPLLTSFLIIAVSQSSTAAVTAPQTTTAPNGGAAAGQNGDYPMEAVLTLMQLNAGWRQ